MEVKSKMKVVSFALSTAFFGLALLLFFLVPVMSKSVAAVYTGVSGFLSGAKIFVSLNFDNGRYLVFMIFMLLFLVGFIWWLIVIIIRKKPINLIWMLISMVLTFVCAMCFAFYVINLEGGSSVIKKIFAIDGNIAFKSLIGASIAFMHLGCMFATLCAYTNLIEMLEGRAHEPACEEDEVREYAREEAAKLLEEQRAQYMEEIDMSLYNDDLKLKRERSSDDEYYDSLIGELGMFKNKKPAQQVNKVVVERKVVAEEPAPVKPVVVEPAPVVKPVVVAPAAPAAEKIERIPFEVRLGAADKVLKAHYNELKSEVLSYGVKSRVSNTGDTFRLHTKTYVKMVVAGKALKLYLALDPKAYKDSTFPILDASKKGLYKEIPLVFKVKSDLSLRRAKQLIADAMAKDGLAQGEVVAHDWAKELK